MTRTDAGDSILALSLSPPPGVSDRSGPRSSESSCASAAAALTLAPAGARSESSAQAKPGKQFCGPIDMRIARDGRWYYHGTAIPRKEMVCLFASVLQRQTDGSYWLITPYEEAQITVEDVPFLAVELFITGCGRDSQFTFRTNVDEMIPLDAAHPLRMNCCGAVTADDDCGPPPYLTVRAGLEARLTRAVYYELVAMGVEEERDGVLLYGVWSGGVFFPLGNPEEWL